MKAGDYVRTKYGTIGIIIEQNEKYLIIPYKTDELFINKNDIVKSSSNIIDLIEVGDYVNGCLVDNINYDLDKAEDIIESITIILPFQDNKDILKNEDIKSIVTKESFSNVEYKVEELK